MKKLFTALVAALMLATPTTAHHRFTDTTSIPEEYTTVMFSGYVCSSFDDLVYELENMNDPTSTLTCGSVENEPFYLQAITMKPFHWHLNGEETDSPGQFLIASFEYEGTTYFIPIDKVLLDEQA